MVVTQGSRDKQPGIEIINSLPKQINVDISASHAMRYHPTATPTVIPVATVVASTKSSSMSSRADRRRDLLFVNASDESDEEDDPCLVPRRRFRQQQGSDVDVGGGGVRPRGGHPSHPDHYDDDRRHHHHHQHHRAYDSPPPYSPPRRLGRFGGLGGGGGFCHDLMRRVRIYAWNHGGMSGGGQYKRRNSFSPSYDDDCDSCDEVDPHSARYDEYASTRVSKRFRNGAGAHQTVGGRGQEQWRQRRRRGSSGYGCQVAVIALALTFIVLSILYAGMLIQRVHDDKELIRLGTVLDSRELTLAPNMAPMDTAAGRLRTAAGQQALSAPAAYTGVTAGANAAATAGAAAADPYVAPSVVKGAWNNDHLRIRPAASLASASGAAAAGGGGPDGGQQQPTDPLPQSGDGMGRGDGDAVAVPIPPSFANLADFPSPPTEDGGDLPVFWHVPKAGGSTVKDIIGGCFIMTLASEMGGQFGHLGDESLKVFEHDGNKYVNVDTTNPAGINKARRLSLAKAGVADVMITSYLYEASTLFSPSHRGRMFTVLRHPIDRAVSMFGYLATATWEPTYDPSLASMTIEEYARSDRVENNWMTRFLSNQMGGELTDEHLAVAKRVLREKFLVGLLSRMDESVRRFEGYFGWRVENRPYLQKCIAQHVSGGSNRNKFTREKVVKGSQAYSLLFWQNKLDIKLYNYSEELFKSQGKHFA